MTVKVPLMPVLKYATQRYKVKIQFHIAGNYIKLRIQFHIAGNYIKLRIQFHIAGNCITSLLMRKQVLTAYK